LLYGMQMNVMIISFLSLKEKANRTSFARMLL
jgi:hypothetical protein